MRKSYIKIVLVLIILTLVLVGCSKESIPEVTPESTPVDGVPVEELVLTLDELKEFDGKDGRRAYVAVDGVIYDLTDEVYWTGGDHNGFSAGKDLTEEIKNVSPHGVAKLQGVPIVGRLEE